MNKIHIRKGRTVGSWFITGPTGVLMAYTHADALKIATRWITAGLWEAGEYSTYLAYRHERSLTR